MQFEHHYCSKVGDLFEYRNPENYLRRIIPEKNPLLFQNGKPTMYSKKSGIQLGGHDWLSETDVIRINRFYSCHEKLSNPAASLSPILIFVYFALLYIF